MKYETGNKQWKVNNVCSTRTQHTDTVTQQLHSVTHTRVASVVGVGFKKASLEMSESVCMWHIHFSRVAFASVHR